MTILDEMTLYWSKQVSNDIAHETIELLDSKKDLFFDDKNCLNSNWEGFCVEVQEEVSMIDRNAFLGEIEALFRRYYDLLAKEEQFTLWIQTQIGQSWLSKTENRQSDTFTYEVAPLEYLDCRELLMTELTQVALDYKSESITRYITYVIRGQEVEVDDFEDDEEEYED